jgi:hypothetical protein
MKALKAMGINEVLSSILLVRVLFLLQFTMQGGALTLGEPLGTSVLGDPGMKSDRVRVAVEGWNFCNRVGIEWPGSPSPRWADCTDVTCDYNGNLPPFSEIDLVGHGCYCVGFNFTIMVLFKILQVASAHTHFCYW